MAVLNDELISQWGKKHVKPYHAEHVNPASMDFTLGDTIRVTHPIWDGMTKRKMLQHIEAGTIEGLPLWAEPQVFDVFWLLPGKFVLCHSAECIKIPVSLTSLLFSKSSTGRIGLEHLHAGYFDPGFGINEDSQATWELHNVAPWPIKLVAGKRLMQMVMLEMIRPPRLDYSVTGRYNGQVGPTPAR